jgi:site-specific DNA-methyltransferase (adenine-specific)
MEVTTKFADQTILIGDSLQWMAKMDADSTDIVITSPPYNIGINYHSYNDNQPRDQYLQWLGWIGAAVRRVLKPHGSFFLNIGSTNLDPWLSLDAASAFRDHFILQNHIVWVKSISIGPDTVGHFKPINSGRFLNQNHETIFHFTKTGRVPVDRLAIGVPFKDKSNIQRRNHTQDRRCAGNTWFVPYETVTSQTQKFDHPASFPLALAVRCIKLHGTTKDTVVFDPFLGSGTTLVAAASLGCIGIGIELDAIYAATALERLKSSIMPTLIVLPD